MAIVSKLMTEAEHKRSTWVARIMYALVMLTFISVCTIAVVTTMKAESERTGFRPITVKQPISFIDTTYLNVKKEAKPNSSTQ